jgi:hypothetical protein
LSTFYDIWTIDKTLKKLFAHELEIRFKLLNCAKAILNAPKKYTPPPLLCKMKIHLYENFLFIIHDNYNQNNLLVSTIITSYLQETIET